MSGDQFDKILRHTLADYKISRGEKRMLNAVLDELNADDNQLAFLRHRAFEIARQEVSDPESAGVLNWLEDVVKVLQPKPEIATRPAEAYFSPGDECAQAITGLLRRTQRTAEICVFTITDNRIADALEDADSRGVKVRIITDNDKATDLGSDIERLRRHGIEVRQDRSEYHMHHKFAIFDGGTLLTGSYNWTRSAAEYNEENIIVTYEPHLTQRFRQTFESLWKDFA